MRESGVASANCNLERTIPLEDLKHKGLSLDTGCSSNWPHVHLPDRQIYSEEARKESNLNSVHVFQLCREYLEVMPHLL